MDDRRHIQTISPQQGIDQLRAHVDFTSYEASADSPLWMRHLASRAKADLGVLGLLGPSGLSVATAVSGRVRPQLDKPSLYLAGLTDLLRASGKHLAIGIPTAARHLPLLLAASAVLANTLDTALGRHRSGVLVVSPDLDLRSRYCDLFVQKEHIDGAHPGSRLRPDGEQIMLKPKVKSTDEGVCFFLPGLVLPVRVKIRPDLVLVDLRFGRWVQRTTDLCTWTTRLWKNAGVIGIYTIGDRDTLSALTEAGFTDFPLDHRAIATCIREDKKPISDGDEDVVDWRVGNAAHYLDRIHEVHPVTCQKLEDLFQQIGSLLDQHSQKESPDLNRAKWLLATLSQLPVPVAWYDGMAVNRGRFTLSRLIESLGARRGTDDGLGAVSQSLKLLFSTVLNELKKGNPRSVALRDLLAKLGLNTSCDTLQVLARDRVSAHALDAWLAVEVFAGEAWLSKLQTQACATYGQVPKRKTMTVMNGALPRRYRWLAGANLGDFVHYLAYPHEIDIIERQLRSIYDSDACDVRRRNRERSVSLVLSCCIEKDVSSECPLPPLSLKTPPRPATKSKHGSEIRLTGGLSDLRNLWEESQKAVQTGRDVEEPAWFQETGEDDIYAESDLLLSDSIAASAETCILLHVHSRSEGSGTLLMPNDAAVDCVRLSIDEELRRLTASEIAVGDVILLLGQTKRAGIFETIVDLAERQPSMEYLGAFRRRWRVVVQGLAAKYSTNHRIDYSRLWRDLKREGATVESEAAIRLWVQGHIIGPETAESIKAVGIVAGNPAVAGKANEFQKAFRKIRGLRRGIGHRLSNMIRTSFKHLALGAVPTRSEALDDRLGIPFDELLETIDIAEVTAIGAPPESIYNLQVGRFTKKN